jgi:hypothetical protein
VPRTSEERKFLASQEESQAVSIPTPEENREEVSFGYEEVVLMKGGRHWDEEGAAYRYQRGLQTVVVDPAVNETI